LRGRGGGSQLAIRRRLIVESCELWLSARERLLEDDAVRVDRDASNLRTEVPLKIGGGDRRDNRAAACSAQDGPPLQVSGFGARDRRPIRIRVRRRPCAPRIVRGLGVARTGKELDAARARRRSAPADGSPG